MAAPLPPACPKCGTQRADEAACRKCGLAADRMETFAAARDAAIPDVLGTAWDKAVESWSDTARHDEVLRLVTQHDAFAWAAARYRTKAGDPIADKQIERVRKAAEVTLMSSATSRKNAGRNPYRATTALLVLLVLLAVGGLLYSMVRGGGTEPTPYSPVKK